MSGRGSAARMTNASSTSVPPPGRGGVVVRFRKGGGGLIGIGARGWDRRTAAALRWWRSRLCWSRTCHGQREVCADAATRGGRGQHHVAAPAAVGPVDHAAGQVRRRPRCRRRCSWRRVRRSCDSFLVVCPASGEVGIRARSRASERSLAATVADGAAHDRGDLRLGQVLVVAQHEHRHAAGGQLAQRLGQAEPESTAAGGAPAGPLRRLAGRCGAAVAQPGATS